MDNKTIKSLFPFFSHHNGKKLCYLDNAATTQKPQTMIDAITTFYESEYATVHRGLYQTSELATIRYERTRITVAQFINATSAQEIIFTKGATESINMLSVAWALNNIKAGNEILLTQAEHHANLIPWQYVAEKTGAQLRFIPLNQKTLQLENPSSYITPNTVLIAATHHSNVLGTVWPAGSLEKLIAVARQANIFTFLDMAQCPAHHSLDVGLLNVDAIAFSGHKMFGPTGIGILYINQRRHQELQPYQRGGAMVESVSFDKTTYKPMPLLLEPGTPPIAEVIGLDATIKFINTTLDYRVIEKHEAYLCTMLYDQLTALPGITIHARKDTIAHDGHLISFSFDNIHAHDLAAFCGEHQVALRAGHHCAQPLVSTILGQQSVLRASLAVYNTEQDIMHLIETLKQGVALLTL